MSTEFRNHGMTDMLKTVYPPKLHFAGGIIIAVTILKFESHENIV